MQNVSPRNPFGDDIVYEPRRIEPSVSGLNEAPLQSLLSEFSLLTQGSPAYGVKPGHAQLVTSPQAGYGKSHLIGRLFRELRDKAIPVYVRPFEDPASCWKSIQDRIVHAMDAPEPCDYEGREPGDPTFLDAFAYGVFAHLIADLVEAGRIPSPSPEKTARALRETTQYGYKLVPRRQWARQVNALFQRQDTPLQMTRRLKEQGLELHTAPRAWLRVLLAYAWSGNEILRESCLDWLRGESIDEESSKGIGIAGWEIPQANASIEQLNELCKNRVLDLCQLAVYYRPFMLCFDQTENYGKDPLLARTLGVVTQVLTDQAHHQMTVMTANLDPWTQRIRPCWEEAHQARLGMPIEMEGLDKQQAEELTYRRLLGEGVSESEVRAFLDRMRPLDALFGEAPRMGVRTFLQGCRRMWENFACLVRSSSKEIQEQFRDYLGKVDKEPGRLVFDRDVLYWVVYELAHDLPGILIDRVETRSGLYLPRWRTGTQQILFSFDGGSHWKRWQTIVERTRDFCQRYPKTKVVYLRTPELKPIPGKDWPNVKEMEEAQRLFLHVLNLDLDQIREIYAAYELHADAVQGNVIHSPDTVTSFLRKRLNVLWEQILQEPMTIDLTHPRHPGSHGGKVPLALV
jgi:hypothetical protein